VFFTSLTVLPVLSLPLSITSLKVCSTSLDIPATSVDVEQSAQLWTHQRSSTMRTFDAPTLKRSYASVSSCRSLLISSASLCFLKVRRYHFSWALSCKNVSISFNILWHNKFHQLEVSSQDTDFSKDLSCTLREPGSSIDWSSSNSWAVIFPAWFANATQSSLLFLTCYRSNLGMRTFSGRRLRVDRPRYTAKSASKPPMDPQQLLPVQEPPLLRMQALRAHR
jgi:hypothetical protein